MPDKQNVSEEISSLNTAWLDPDHPNFRRWERGRELQQKRASVVRELISSERKCEGLCILDLGSGEGGTSALFSEDNEVVSYDLSISRLKRQRKHQSDYPLINGRAEFLPFRDSSFDLVILQDVIEHVEQPLKLIQELSRVLQNNGLIYLSTPNRNSIINIVSDPHWGIPLLALFKREGIKKYFLRYFRKSELSRNDIAALFSLKELKDLFKGYKMKFKTSDIVNLVYRNSEGIMWSKFHLLLLKLLRYSGLMHALKKIASDKEGFLNNYLTPTFYVVLKKIPAN